MGVQNIFDWTCEALESASQLSRLEARGTVRLALKTAGLQVRSLDPREMKAVLTKILPEELDRRAVADAEGLCSNIAKRLAREDFASQTVDTPEEVFARLGGRDEAGD